MILSYQMPLGNVQSYDASGGRGVCSNRQECRHMGKDLAKSSYNFYSGWKSLIHSSSIYDIMWGEVENVIWGEGSVENIKIPSYGGGGLKLLKKPSYDIWTFPWRETDASVMSNVRERNEESSTALLSVLLRSLLHKMIREVYCTIRCFVYKTTAMVFKTAKGNLW